MYTRDASAPWAKTSPRRDVLIVGGGLAGAATAYYLAREGVEVTLVERFDLNTQASGSNAGSLHAQIPHEPSSSRARTGRAIFAPTIPLMLESIRLWQGLEAELGADLEVSLDGGLLVAESEAQLRDIERKARDRARRRGWRSSCSTGRSLRRRRALSAPSA